MTAESLPADLVHVLDAVLSTVEDPRLALGLQTRHLWVRTRCACGCDSADFSLDTAAVAPAPAVTGTRVVAETELFGTGGETVGEVLVFAEDGYLSRLEVCSWGDELLTLTDAHRILCPCDCPGRGAPRAFGFALPVTVRPG
ncbi:hypothetical protein [Streptomyces murinus]|uniref:hypothetical protein n=1 Tax=Streptomyces murinus TaxID=33900 RepID=UPI003808A3D6